MEQMDVAEMSKGLVKDRVTVMIEECLRGANGYLMNSNTPRSEPYNVIERSDSFPDYFLELSRQFPAKTSRSDRISTLALLKVIDIALHRLEEAANGPLNGDEPPERNDLAPRPVWRDAQSPAVISAYNETSEYNSLQAELQIKMEMLCSAASAARKRLDIARAREGWAISRCDSLVRELEDARQVVAQYQSPSPATTPALTGILRRPAGMPSPN
eukprot:CAMPEP_0113715002 /NCGR_PEP_ID=MMETSP0038_2-20120614/32993_1 /TAXON_ID=2898 /ORGANISM="Cryptomonas paramecium" /LENGTH=214 /DNA_ID=CAMNT_0000642167 /DNA_START=64 /DNA_END=705 /DNA_ORIENTATION=+ /assembly_acc=CAM_ASM_000170